MGQWHVSVSVPKNSTRLYITTGRHRLEVITNFWSKNAPVYEQLTRTFKYYVEMSFFRLRNSISVDGGLCRLLLIDVNC